MLTLIVFGLSLIYLLAGTFSTVQMHRHEVFPNFWTLSAAFWLFLAVGLWRFSRIARTITVTMLWCAVLILPFAILEPANLAMISLSLADPDIYDVRAIAIPTLMLSVLGMMVLNKHKDEFR